MDRNLLELLKTLQIKISKALIINDEYLPPQIKLIGGADATFFRKGKREYAIGCVTILSYPEGKLLFWESSLCEINFPYIPGFLAFRELRPLWLAWKKLKSHPDIWILDGQGIAHPRRMGIASHFGVLTGEPAIGCAKSHLFGDYREPPCPGGHSEILYDGEKIGWVYRPSSSRKLWFISPGHKVSPDTALEVVRKMAFYASMPEPIRHAHLKLKELSEKLKIKK